MTPTAGKKITKERGKINIYVTATLERILELRKQMICEKSKKCTQQHK